MECPVMNELKWRVKNTARLKAVSEEVKISDATQRERNAELDRKVGLSHGLTFVSKTASKGNIIRKSEERERESESRGRTRSQIMRRPKLNKKQKLQSVGAV